MDKYQTRTKFILFHGDIVALFPDEIYNESLYGKRQIMSYAHVGQHGPASKDLMHCTKASYSQYQYLMEELQRLGYQLQITN